MAGTKTLRFVELQTGCYIPLSHELNQDGYFRKRWRTNDGDVAEMFHRYIWRCYNGEIPDGYSVHHKCGVRSCFNVKHLKLIETKEHAKLTNMERHKNYVEQGKHYMPHWAETH